jgi:hypothetical protein
MDEDKIKPKLLVVGDSFMKPDLAYPGQHWSEMLPEYDVLMFSIDGSSNGIIARQFYQGLELKPDAVILGFTEPNRVEFEYQNRWITGSYNSYLTTEQKLLADLYKIHVPEEMLMIRDCSLVRGLLSTLEQKQIPYAWTLNLLFNNLSQLPFPSDLWVNKILGDFFYRMTPTNLATYQGWKHSPGFHTDDPVWQTRFAAEVREILQK